MSYQIVQGRMEDVCRTLPPEIFDGLLCDPPYGLKFMSKRWDYQVPSTEQWREAYRCMKPGAYLVAFGGTRTYHRMVCNIEDAGFEIRDQLAWIYGSGMPKSTNASKLFDKAAGVERPVLGPDPFAARRIGQTVPKFQNSYGELGGEGVLVPVTGDVTEQAQRFSGYGTGLKPCLEPIVLARKPLVGTIIQNAERYGTGLLNIQASRIGDIGGTKLNGVGDREYLDSGRWPGNVMFDEDMAALLDAIVGERPSTLTGRADPEDSHENPGDNDGASWFGGGNSRVYADGGGPSRFFYCPKANRRERDLGCGDLPASTGGQATGRVDGSIGAQNPRAGAGWTGGARNTHPTVKPVALTEWLARLILPPDAATRVLYVPFAGVGSEIAGAVRAGWGTVLGVELDEEGTYLPIANRRIPALIAL